MSKSLALHLARKLTDSRVPLDERANLARHVRRSEIARLVAALATVIALMPREVTPRS